MANETTSPDAGKDETAQYAFVIKASVYQSGMIGGLGIKCSEPRKVRDALKNPEQSGAVKKWLKEAVDAEISRRNVSYGLIDGAVESTIDTILSNILKGEKPMAVQKIAVGESPVAGSDGRLEYRLNPEGLPLSQSKNSVPVRRVKEGEVLVLRHPPEAGKDGCDVRGEPVVPGRMPLEVPLESIVGTNTSVVDEQLQATLQGVYWEDPNGRVFVIQEIAVGEINAATGDLPRSGTATASFWIKGGVRTGTGVFTSENIMIGAPRAPAALDGETRIRARNLFVNGQIGGVRLVTELVHGEPEKLGASERHRAEGQVESTQIEIAETFGANEVLGRPVSAGRILIQSQGYMSLLSAETDVLIDGDLVGGVTAFGRRLQVFGNLGNRSGTPTQIRLCAESHTDKVQSQDEQSQERLKVLIQQAQEAVEAHKRILDARSGKSEYWAALANGETRVPKGPIEQKLLVQFHSMSKEHARLLQEVEVAKDNLADLIARAENEAEDGEAENGDLTIGVGKSIFPGVCIQLVSELEEEDLEKTVVLQGAGPCTLQQVKGQLDGELKEFLQDREEQISEKKAALEQMFEGRDQMPTLPQVDNRCFEANFAVVKEAEGEGEGEGASGNILPMSGALCVYAQEPQTYYLKRLWPISDRMENVTLKISREEGDPVVSVISNEIALERWQASPEILEELETIQVLDLTGRAILAI